eukprot:1801565-Amphidinium_carterae.1
MNLLQAGTYVGHSLMHAAASDFLQGHTRCFIFGHVSHHSHCRGRCEVVDCRVTDKAPVGV